MGARQSKRSVDITTTPKKDGVPSDGGIVGDAAAPGDGKLERIEEADTKPTSNGVAPHTDVVDKDKDEVTEKDKQQEDTKPEEAEAPVVDGGEVTTPTEGTPSSPDAATSPESKETKKKDKMKKKWSLRSISFSKKDKSKPAREDTPKNGDVTKEEPLAEGGEEVEAVNSPAEEKKSPAAPVESSPTTETVQVATAAATTAVTATVAAVATAVEAKEEEKTAPVAKSPIEEKKEEPTVVVAPTVVPVEEKKEEIEKVEPVVAEKVESEEDPLPVSKEVLIEAKPAVVVPEDSLNVKEKSVSLEANENRVNEPISDAVVVVVPEKELVKVDEPKAEAPVCHLQATKIEPSQSEPIVQIDSTKNEIDDDVPPPLPESPVPVLENAEDLPAPPIVREKEHSFSAEPLEPTIISTSIVSEKEVAHLLGFAACPLPPDNIPDTLIKIPLTQEIVNRTDTVSKYLLPSEDLPCPPLSEELSCPLPPKELSCPVLPKNTTFDPVLECPVTVCPLPLKNPTETETVQTSVRSATTDDNVSIECAQIQQSIDDQNNQDFKVASLSQNLDLYNDSNFELNERLAKSEEKNGEESASVCPLSNATSTAVLENDQSTAESEAPVENVTVNDIGTSESMDEAPTSPPPAIPVEIPVSPVHLTVLAPAITEDVASVTKAIEEIDISGKAVAAAVNEAIASANANEIVTDSLHQNNMNE